MRHFGEKILFAGERLRSTVADDGTYDERNFPWYEKASEDHSFCCAIRFSPLIIKESVDPAHFRKV